MISDWLHIPKAEPSKEQRQRPHTAGETDITTTVKSLNKQKRQQVTGGVGGRCQSTTLQQYIT